MNIKEGDVVECLTADGWEDGIVTKVNQQSLIVYMYYINQEVEFDLHLVRA